MVKEEEELIESLFRAGRSGRGRLRVPKGAEPPVAHFIRLARVSQGLTQRELADRCSVPLKTIREVEQGKPTVRMDTLNRILEYFGHEVGAIPLSRKERSE